MPPHPRRTRRILLVAASALILVFASSTAYLFRDGPCVSQLPEGTAFGASISTSGITAQASMAEVDEAFGPVPIVRTFDPGMPLQWWRLRNEMVSGRDVVTSFRPMPDEVLSGVHDERFREWFEQAPNDVDIYWSYIHEPEPLLKDGTFTQAEYFAAWEHLADIADTVCRPKMHSTLILTGFTANDADIDYRDFDPGPDIVDVIGWDPYNGVYAPERTFYQSPETLLGPIVDIMEADGRPWGIAEIGSRLIPGDPDGTRRARWLEEVSTYAEDNGALFVTYFQSTRGANWRLDDPASRRMWSALVENGT